MFSIYGFLRHKSRCNVEKLIYLKIETFGLVNKLFKLESSEPK